MPSALTSIGHQQLSVSSTALALTVPSGLRPCHALIQCGATNTVRWIADGVTDPTSSLGILLAAGTVLDLTDPEGDYATVINQIKFIKTGNDATLDIEYFV